MGLTHSAEGDANLQSSPREEKGQEHVHDPRTPSPDRPIPTVEVDVIPEINVFDEGVEAHPNSRAASGYESIREDTADVELDLLFESDEDDETDDRSQRPPAPNRPPMLFAPADHPGHQSGPLLKAPGLLKPAVKGPGDFSLSPEPTTQEISSFFCRGCLQMGQIRIYGPQECTTTDDGARCLHCQWDFDLKSGLTKRGAVLRFPVVPHKDQARKWLCIPCSLSTQCMITNAVWLDTCKHPDGSCGSQSSSSRIWLL